MSTDTKAEITPEEKAKELVDMFSKIVEYTDSDTDSVETDIYVAKQCALMTVYHIIKVLLETGAAYDSEYEYKINKDIAFYEKVREALPNI